MGPLAGVRIVEFAGIGPGPFGLLMVESPGDAVCAMTQEQPHQSNAAANPFWNAFM